MAHLIDKDALVAEIEKKIKQYEDAFNNPSFASYEACLIAKGKYRKLLDILQFINTLETKEVDLKKEIASYIHDNTINGYFRADIHDVAEYFFELGLKAQKGE